MPARAAECPGRAVCGWLAPLTLAQLRQERQYRYGGEGEIDAAFRFRERSRALLFNARWARQAIELAGRLGL